MTIARNRKRLIRELFEKGTNFRCYSLSNGFTGTAVEREWVEKEFSTYTDVKLRERKPGTFWLRIHGNLWYEFDAEGVIGQK
jgi:hypothetical protein